MDNANVLYIDNGVLYSYTIRHNKYLYQPTRNPKSIADGFVD